MDKDLEKEYLEDLDHYDEGMGIHSTSYEKCKERLIRLAKIDQAEPSEALECLEWIIKNYIGNDYYVYEEELITIKQALLKAQEQEKVLNILKEKPLSLLVFKTFKIYDKDGVLKLDYQYFVDCHKAISEELDEEAQEQVTTEEEFNLLKRYFNEEKD